MRYPGDRHVLPLLAPEGGQPTWEETFIENNTKQGLFSKPNQSKQKQIGFEKWQQIYPSNK